MKPAHMKSTTYKENDKGDPKFEDTQHKICYKRRFKKKTTCVEILQNLLMLMNEILIS